MTPTQGDDPEATTRRRGLPSAATTPRAIVWLTDLRHMPEALPEAVYYALAAVEAETLDSDQFSYAVAGVGDDACEEYDLDPGLSPLIEREVVRRVAAAAGHGPTPFPYPDTQAPALLDALPRTVLTALVHTARDVFDPPAPAPAATRLAALARTDRATTHTDLPAGPPHPLTPTTARSRR